MAWLPPHALILDLQSNPSHPTPWSWTHNLQNQETRNTMWQPCLQSTPSFQRRRPPNLQIFNITDHASVCSKCADVPTDETGNPFCMLQKRSSVKREKGHAGDNLSNAKQHVLSLLHWCHWNPERLTGRKLRLMPASTSCCGQKVYSLPGRQNRSTQSFYLFWFV